MKNNIEGHWMEVRSEEIGIDIGIAMPSLEFQFYPSGKVKLKEYDDSQSKYLNGQYIIEDSFLTINPKQPGKFREYLRHSNFIIETYNKDLLILRSHTEAKVPKFRYYFIPNHLYKTFSSDEIKSNYTFTNDDSIKQIAYDRRKQALKELQKNDRSVPEFPGGHIALNKYLSENIIYSKKHTEPTGVKISFEVDVDGKISNVQSMIAYETDYTLEAIRLVKAMPDWLPAQFDGVPQKLKTNVFVEFKVK